MKTVVMPGMSTFFCAPLQNNIISRDKELLTPYYLYETEERVCSGALSKQRIAERGNGGERGI
jgi:hypothetical protein